LFLLYKSVKEIHEKVAETEEGKEQGMTVTAASFGSVIVQIVLIDIVFSFDSVITAVGMVEHIEIMIAAVVISMFIMMLIATSLSDFVNRNPAIKILALSFLMMIGMALIAEGVDFHIPKGYIYFAMAFAVLVEIINIRIGTRSRKPV
jgi:predicted tellurium resistance membrane protein TerC